MYELIKESIGSSAKLIVENERIRTEKSEVYRLCCDNGFIKELTGFEPSYSLQKGLAETIEWFSKKENLVKFKTNIYNV